MSRPESFDYPDYFSVYISKVPEDNLPDAFANQFPLIKELLSGISEEQSMFAYAPGKWTIKAMMQHIIDAERIFAYRAVCFARKEQISLPPFEENAYADNADADRRGWLSLVNEFLNLRRSTRDLFESFTDEMLKQRGTANNRQMTVMSIGYVTIGHVYHHFNVIKEKYIQS